MGRRHEAPFKKSAILTDGVDLKMYLACRGSFVWRIPVWQADLLLVFRKPSSHHAFTMTGKDGRIERDFSVQTPNPRRGVFTTTKQETRIRRPLYVGHLVVMTGEGSLSEKRRKGQTFIGIWVWRVRGLPDLDIMAHGSAKIPARR